MSIIKKLVETTQPQWNQNEKKDIENLEKIDSMKQDIFLVHGHNDSMKQTVARTLEKFGTNAIVLHEQASRGRTIIKKFEDYSDVNYAVVLLSADDFGYSKREGLDNQKQRARQNVVFEMGFFVGKLGRENVFILVETSRNFEIPGDYGGVIYISYDNDDWRLKLAKEMSAAGLDIDTKGLFSLH